MKRTILGLVSGLAAAVCLVAMAVSLVAMAVSLVAMAISPRSAAASARPVPAATIEMREAALLLDGQEGGSLPMALLVLAGAPVADSEGLSLIAQLEVDLVEREAGAPDDGSTLEVFVYVVAEGARVVDAVTLSVSLDGLWPGDSGGDKPLRILAPIVGEAGPIEVRALARRGESFGLRRSALALPAASPPLVRSEARWPIVYPADRPPALAAPWSLDGPLPSSLPVVAAGGLLPLEPGSAPDPPKGVWHLGREASPRADDGTAFALRAVDDSSRGPRLEVPPEVEPGLWHLRAEGSGGPALRLAVVEPESGVGRGLEGGLGAGVDAVSEGGDGRRVGDWRALVSRDDEPRPIVPAPVLPEGELRRRERRELMLTVYRETRAVLETLGRRGLRVAADELAEREQELVSTHGADVLEPLAVGQLAAFLELARAARTAERPDAVLPAIFLTSRVARSHLLARRHLLARTGLIRTRRLIEAWSEEAGAPPAEAGRALAVLSLRPLRNGALSIASQLLERSLELAPGDEAALLALGALHARGQRLDEAMQSFESLLAVAPDHAEARRRLAIVARRRGDVDQARRHLERLRDDPSWLGEIAIQELVRLDLVAGALQPAIARARDGLARRPDDQSLRVALAWALVASGDDRESHEAITALAPDQRSSSARGALVDLPLGRLGARQRELLVAAEAARGALLEIFASMPTHDVPPRWALAAAAP